ncbi:MAG: hypothetical protein ABIP44_01175 [Pseudoxanthomonas sp.]
MHWKPPFASLFVSGFGLGLSLVLALPAHAQDPVKHAADAGIRAQLAELDYQYELDEDNDFKLVFEVGEEGRSQIVYILSPVESYGEHRVREIWSPGYKSPTDEFAGPIANRLLEASNSAKLGGWVKQGRNAIFVVKIPANAGNQVLDDAISAASGLADAMEAELSPGTDEL